MDNLTSEDMENLLFLFLLLHPATSAERIYNYWHKDKVLREYDRPEKEELNLIVSNVKSDIRLLLIQV